MGVLVRHAIAVTSGRAHHNYLDDARDYAHSVGAQCTPIMETLVNNERTFFVCPDGSKESWGASYRGDEQRELIVEYLRSVAYDDGSSPLSWAEFYYGSDFKDAGIVNHDGELYNEK